MAYLVLEQDNKCDNSYTHQFVENGAEELHLSKLFERVKSGRAVREVLIATPYTPEGDATAHFIAKAMASVAPDVRVTRLARGIPAGVELEFTDANTIAGAIFARR